MLNGMFLDFLTIPVIQIPWCKRAFVAYYWLRLAKYSPHLWRSQNVKTSVSLKRKKTVFYEQLSSSPSRPCVETWFKAEGHTSTSHLWGYNAATSKNEPPMSHCQKWFWDVWLICLYNIWITCMYNVWITCMYNVWITCMYNFRTMLV
jgi:hypothetical protein